MIDMSVAVDKLYGFETADELADYFRGYGIKAQPRNPLACPITKFVVTETGKRYITTNTSSVRLENKEGQVLESFPHSDAMADFVEMYDTGYYPDLVEEGFENLTFDYNNGG